MGTIKHGLRIPRLRGDLPEGHGLRSILWPVQIIHLMAETNDEDAEFGPFATLVLAFLKADGSLNVKSLAREICVPEDFVACIVRRLQDKNLVDEYLHVTNSKQKAKTRPLNMLAFRELVSGTVLPFIAISQKENFSFDFCCPEENSFVFSKKEKPTPITIEDVARAFLMMKRRAQSKLNLPKLKSIRFGTDEEETMLQCFLQLDEADGGIRILNPFTDKANPFESTLEALFKREEASNKALANWLLDWRRSVRTDIYEGKPVGNYGFDTTENRKKYPQLVAALKRTNNKSYESIYSVIEWALFYSERMFKGVDVGRVYNSFDSRISVASYQLLGMKIGLPENSVDAIDEASLRGYENGKPEMITALAISAANAKMDPRIPFAKLMSGNADFISNILQLKRFRDKSVHGASSENEANDSVVHWMMDVVKILLPDMMVTDDDFVKAENIGIFDARTNLIEKSELKVSID